MIDTLYFFQQLLVFHLLKTTIWNLLILGTCALAAWQLSKVLDKHNARGREARLSRRIAWSYAASGIVLWLFSAIFY